MILPVRACIFGSWRDAPTRFWIHLRSSPTGPPAAPRRKPRPRWSIAAPIESVQGIQRKAQQFARLLIRKYRPVGQRREIKYPLLSI